MMINKYITSDTNKLVNNPDFGDNSSRIATTKFVKDSIKNQNPVRRGMFCSESSSNGMILDNNFIKPLGNELIWNTNHSDKGIRLSVSENDDFIPWGKGGTWCWREPEAKSFESLNFFTTENNDGTDNSIGYPYDVKFQLWGTNDLTLVADNTYNDTQHPFLPEKREITNNGWTFIGDFAFTGKDTNNHYVRGVHKILKKDVLGMGDLISKSDWTIPAEAFGIWMIYIPNTSDYFQNPLTIQSVITDTSQQNIQLDIPDGNNTVEILVVGGGGAGGRIHDPAPPDSLRVLNQFVYDGAPKQIIQPTLGAIWNTTDLGKGITIKTGGISEKQNQLIVTTEGDRWVFAPWGGDSTYIWREKTKVSFQSLNFYVTDTTGLNTNSLIQLWGCKNEFKFTYQKSNHGLLMYVEEDFMPMKTPWLTDPGLNDWPEPPSHPNNNNNWVFLGLFNLGSDKIGAIGAYSFTLADALSGPGTTVWENQPEISTEKFGVFMMTKPYGSNYHNETPIISRIAININANDSAFWGDGNGNGGDIVRYDSNLDYFSANEWNTIFGPFDVQLSTINDWNNYNVSSQTFTVTYEELSTIKNAGGGAGGLIHIPEWNISGETTLDITIGEGGKYVNNSTGVSGQGGNTIVKAGSTKTLTALGGGMGDSDGNLFDGIKQGNNGGCGGGGFNSLSGLSIQAKDTNDGVNTYSNSGFGTPSNIPYNISPISNGFGVGDIVTSIIEDQKYLQSIDLAIDNPSWGSSLSNTLSVSMWIYHTGIQGNIVNQGFQYGSKEYGWVIFLGPDTSDAFNTKCITWCSGNNSDNLNGQYTRQTPTDSIKNNTWHHILVTKNFDVLKIYIDNVEQTLKAGGTASSGNLPRSDIKYPRDTIFTLSRQVDKRADGTMGYFDGPFIGFIDQLYIFNEVISSSLANELYSSRYFPTTSPNKMSGIIAHWSFNNSLESTINSNDTFSGNTPVYILDIDAPKEIDSTTSTTSGGIGKYFGNIFGNNVGTNGWFGSGGITSVTGSQLDFNINKWKGGGGDGNNNNISTISNAIENTGGGGGSSGNGGSGIVIVKYKKYISKLEHVTPLISRIAINTSADDTYWSVGDIQETPSHKINTTYRINYVSNKFHNQYANKLIFPEEDERVQVRRGMFSSELFSYNMTGTYNVPTDGSLIWNTNQEGKGIRLHTSQYHENYPWGYGGTWCWREPTMKSFESLNFYTTETLSRDLDTRFQLWATNELTIYNNNEFKESQHHTKIEKVEVITLITAFEAGFDLDGVDNSSNETTLTSTGKDTSLLAQHKASNESLSINGLSIPIHNDGDYFKYIISNSTVTSHIVAVYKELGPGVSDHLNLWIHPYTNYSNTGGPQLGYKSNQEGTSYKAFPIGGGTPIVEFNNPIFPRLDGAIYICDVKKNTQFYTITMHYFDGNSWTSETSSNIVNTEPFTKVETVNPSGWSNHYANQCFCAFYYNSTIVDEESYLDFLKSKWQTFHTNSTSSWNSLIKTGESINVLNYLIVAGGGAGASSHGGGGGAGGLRTTWGSKNGGDKAIDDSLTIDFETNYSVSIGTGGKAKPAGEWNHHAESGTDSSFLDIICIGGGGGSASNGAKDGGCGGGGGYLQGPGGQALGTEPNGFNGGIGGQNSDPWPAGGGGGAGGPGENAELNNGTSSKAGNGGIGISNDITGINTFYAGGGGGGLHSDKPNLVGIGGSDVGGDGAGKSKAGTGVINTGSGGGGASRDLPGECGSGSDGVVILRYNKVFTLVIDSDNLITSKLNIPVENNDTDYITILTGGTGIIKFTITKNEISFPESINNWNFIGDFSFKDTHNIRGAHTIGKLDTLGAAANYTSSEWIPKIPNDKFGIWMIYCPNISPYTSEFDVTYKNTPLMSRIGINTPSDNQSWIDDIEETPSNKINTEYTIKYSATQNIQSKPVTKPEKENLILTSVKDGSWDWKEPAKVESFDSLKLSDNTIIATIPNIQTEILANNEKIEATGIRFHVLSGQLYIHSLGIYRTKDDMDNNNNNIAKESGVTFNSGANDGNKTYTVNNNQEYFIKTGSAQEWPMGHVRDGKHQVSRDYNDNYVINFSGLREIKYVRFPDYMYNGGGGDNQIFRVEYTIDGVNYIPLKAFSIGDRNVTTENIGLIHAWVTNPQYINNQFWQLEKKTKPDIQYSIKSILGPITGDGISIIYVDTQNTGEEGVVPITDRPNPSNTNKHGVFWGNRLRYWMVQDKAFFYYGRDIAHNRLINGNAWVYNNSEPDNDNYFPYYHRIGGHVTLTPYGPYRYNFTRFYTILMGNNNSLANSTHEFRISASNNGATWITLCEFRVQSMIYDPDRQFTVGTDIRTQTNLSFRKYFIEWENTNYYSMWRVSHIDDGYTKSSTNPSGMASGSSQGYNWLFNTDYCFGEYEWG